MIWTEAQIDILTEPNEKGAELLAREIDPLLLAMWNAEEAK